jgi:hypothetical protein
MMMTTKMIISARIMVLIMMVVMMITRVARVCTIMELESLGLRHGSDHFR